VRENLGEPVLVPPDHQTVVALGAAVEAARKLRRLKTGGVE
jgi:activator of 2-hydroxyglutaryl-CoA dehydratase